MFRWTLMLRKLFASSQGLKAGRPGKTVKPNLEGLTERILLSASMVALPPSTPPAAAQVTALVTATMDQWNHFIVSVEQKLSSDLQMVEQRLVQDVVFVLQQWDHFLGFAPDTPNPSPVPAGQQAGSGSGSGSSSSGHAGLPVVRMSGSGSGSGSGAATTAHDNSPTPGNLKAVPFVNPDVYTWDPQGVGSGSGGGGGNYLASNPKNWLKNGQVQGASGTVPGNQATDTAVFDGAYDQPIEWDSGGGKYTKYNFSTMTLGNAANGKAYDKLQTIDGGITVELNGQNGSSLNTNVNSSNLNLDFTSTSKFQIDANATITNMTLAGNQAGQFLINGGTTKIAANPGGYSDTIGVAFTIAQGATLNDQSYNALVFGNNNLAITVNGEMDVYYGVGQTNTLIDKGVYSNDYINVNGGTLYYGGKGGVTDTFKVPVLVQNAGNFMVSSAANQPNGGKLIVQGVVPNQTPNASVYLADVGVGSTVQLSNGATLEADNDFYSKGILRTTDATTCMLQDGPQGTGTATVNGSVMIATSKTYGELDVAGNLSLGASLYVSVQGYTFDPTNPLPGTSGLLQVSGTLTINDTTGSLNVDDNGNLVKNDFWIVVQSPNKIGGDFGNKKAIPQANLAYGPPNNPVQGEYRITYNG